ncbi:MAG: thioredoxin domain-containing protein [Christensenellales bacterium]|jgi:uncharacterized protein YyaL (SSP411 family)
MNALINEKSPYLIQHAQNPVDWLPWGEPAFARARLEDKPVFLSIGYSTCHWCHVMARESFEDAQVAEILNEHFISIKVDREERPDIDQIYMDACMALTGSGGWPLTAILTPEQAPFFAATYLPKTARYGQTGLIELLEAVTTMWRERRAEVVEMGRQIAQHIAQPRTSARADVDLSPAFLARAAARAGADYHKKSGGFGNAPLFPMPHRLLLLLRTGAREKVRGALTQMARGGIFDHLGGGFSRYSTDDKWLAPHFEKMLYDNALLAYVYAEAAIALDEPFFAQAAEATLDYALREMRDARGGFYCAQDADSEGVEGRYYVFTPTEIERVLGQDAQAFCARYDITPAGNFEGASILNLLHDGDYRHAAAQFAEQRAALYAYRAQRAPLHKDDKVLTAWNAMMIAALSRAGALFERADYLAAADDAVRFVRKYLTAPDGGLYARYRAGEAGIEGTLDDYAFHIWALIEHHRARHDIESLLEAKRLAHIAHEQFFDSENGGYFMTASHELIMRPKETYDGATPSGNSALLYAYTLLRAYSGERVWAQRSDALIDFLAPDLAENPSAHTFALCALANILAPPAKWIAACASEADAREARETAAAQANVCALILSPETRNAHIAFDPDLADYSPPESGVLWYVCEGGVCAPPTADAPGAVAQITQ